MVTVLPTFRGWTVDVRLRQFRKASPASGIAFVDFDSEEGDALLSEMADRADAGSEDGRSLLALLLEVL